MPEGEPSDASFGSRRPVDRFRVSVCIPTYNGERFLREQLDSLLAQTRVPDEILVADDCSSDATLNVVAEFASISPVVVRTLPSDVNIGLCANVRRLVESAEGDVVFFCDQDDVWLPDKVATLLSYLDRPDVEAVCCNSRPFTAGSSEPATRTVWEIALDGVVPEASSDVLGSRNFIMGHNIAIRREALQRDLWPVGADVFYDYWIALVTSARGTMALCPAVLTMYRQHDDSVIGVLGRRDTSRNVRNWTMTANTLDGVIDHLSDKGVVLDAAVVDRMRARSAYLRRRAAYRDAPLRHLATPFRLVLSDHGYFAFGNGWESFGGDLLALADRSCGRHARRLGRLADRSQDGTTARSRVPASELRLGVYADLSYRRDDRGISTTTAFISWLSELAGQVGQLVLFGRVDPVPGRAPFELPASGSVHFVELPFYPSLHRLAAVARATPRSWWRWHRKLADCDALLLFGPHPLGTLLGMEARARRIPVFVGVRENLNDYLRHRTAGWRHRLVRPAAAAMQQAHLRLASAGAIVVGGEMASIYAAHGVTVLQTGISLLRQEQFLPLERVLARAWPGSSTILVVGRLDPEKNPRLLLDVAAALQQGGRWNIEVAGTGSMADDLRREAGERGLTNITFHGRLIRNELAALYRERATMLLHVSLTEGQPQILYEAAAFGLPIVATAVGGVASALGNGERGLLVPPCDLDAILDAIELLDSDPVRRAQLIEAAWRWSYEETIEAQTRRVGDFLRQQLMQAG
ncbi:MAG TPA: glycosyltransferase [Acidimicrobiales bacterium]|nr:glycosyltransferase [Acidimicrobiales bacterium]